MFRQLFIVVDTKKASQRERQLDFDVDGRAKSQ